jgi:histidine ammonia-lyase
VDVLQIDGTGLTTAQIVAAARGNVPVTVTGAAQERAAASQRAADRVAAERPLYGRSTGVGANKSVAAAADPELHARQLIRSHATSAGPLRSAERVRAMMVIRLNQLAAGGSGADPALLPALARLLDGGELPPVREWGSIGTGDLSALATTALTLAGHPYSVRFGGPDGLAFLSSNAATLADAALAVADLRRLSHAALVIAALTFTAVDGNPEAFAPVVERVTPFPGARAVCRTMRALTDASPARIQDPFALRTIPQVMGPLLDALDGADRTVTALVNAPGENPVLLAAPDGSVQVAHHGGFFAGYLQAALDAATLAVAQSGPAVLGRLAMLIDPQFTGLRPFLADADAASGVMVCEYVAASALGELRAAATPAGVQTVELSRGVENDASFASQAARQALRAVEAFRTVLACELVASVRALRMRDRRTPLALAPALEVVRDLPAPGPDRDLTGDLELAGNLLPALADLAGQAMSSSGRSSSA